MALHEDRDLCTPALRALSYRFAVRCDDARMARHIGRLLAGLRDECDAAPVDHWYALTRGDHGAATFDVTRDGQLLAQGRQPADAVGWVVWDVNRAAAVAGGDTSLLFHSGGIEVGGRGVLLPGASGSGKSTLTAGLVRRGGGMAYLSDELVALDLESGHLLPYAKPITVKPGSFEVLRDLGPGQATGRGEADLWTGEEWQVAVGGRSGLRPGGSCPPGFVIVPSYAEGAPTTMEPLSETEAFFALAVNAVNLSAHGSRGTEVLGRLADRCVCAALTFSDLDRACELVRMVVRDPAVLARGVTVGVAEMSEVGEVSGG